MRGRSRGLLENGANSPRGCAKAPYAVPTPSRTHAPTHKPMTVLCLLQTLPPLLAEFSARALDPLRAVKHGLMPWLE